MNWYIGQEIVCIDAKGANSTDGTLSSGLQEGKVYVIRGLGSPICNCRLITIDVGIAGPTKSFGCKICNSYGHPTNGKWWFKESRFAPLQDLSEQIASLLEQKQIA